MRLYIAEKPSLAKAIAEVLPKPHKKQEGCIVVGNGDVVSWCIGHLLEQVEPEHYDSAYKKWALETLPIIPQKWALKPKSKTRKQLTVLKGLIKQAHELVHAGDPDREGQLLVDEVIDYAGVSAAKKQSIKRCLIADLNPSAVKRALVGLKDNRQFAPLSISALARTRADWLYGINLTRAYTVQGRKVGFDGLLSVGRVQTPLLGLVVRRDLEIANFVSKPFYEVLAHVRDGNNQCFSAKWQPSDACQPYMDEQGRVLVKALAENVAGRISNQVATVTQFERKLKKQNAPLPFNLSQLQIDAAKRFGMNAQKVLDIAQALYERHKLITYPRSESRHLPVEHFAQAPSVVNAISGSSSELSRYTQQADLSRKSSAFNDSKVTAHHAIVPTEKTMAPGRISADEQKIYDLIARQYLAQFYPAFEFYETKVELEIGGGRFTASAKQTHSLGWKVMYGGDRPSKKSDSEDGSDSTSALPAMQVGDQLHCDKGEVLEKQTQPPKHFTDATLLAAMTGIARYVKDPAIRKVLNDTDGLGTEATRAGIIELLFKRGFLTRNGKMIRATEAGIGLIQSLPEVATVPDMTARWESQLGKIADKAFSYDGFMGDMLGVLNGLVETARNELPMHLQGVKAAKPRFAKGKRRAYGKGGSSSYSAKKRSSASTARGGGRGRNAA